MKEFSRRCIQETQVSLIRTYSEAVSRYEDGINLTIGEPDFATPERIKQAGIHAIAENHTHYSPDEGLLCLREEASKYFAREFSLKYDPEEILVTVGATEALDCVFRTVLSPGDEVLLPMPIYLGYDPLIRFAGAEPVYMDTTGDRFLVTPAMLDRYVTPYTRCLLLSYPNNPTGALMNREQLESIAAWLRRHPDILVISDEVYAGLTFAGKHVSIASLPGMKERTAVIQAVSKSYAMTGWRVGFLMAPRKLTAQLYKVHQDAVTSTSTISQYAAAEALKDSSETEMMCEAYKERAEYLYHALNALALNTAQPGGAFYVFPDISGTGMTSSEFADALMSEYHAGVIPGNAFGSAGEGYVRISCAADIGILKEFIHRLRLFLG